MNKKLILALAFAAISGTSLHSQVVTFNYTGGVQTYTVPTCVFLLDVEVAGAEGGGASGSGGDGSLVTGTIAVTPGQVLEIYVGNMGALTSGGFNGGGNGKPGASASGGGGGSSDIRVAPYGLADRIVIGGGGGGTGGGDTYAQGGSGGDPSGTTGIASFGSPGGGGTATAGGLGGAPWGSCGSWGGNGALLNGGAGGTDVCYGLGPGGGGGGGRYGGGGGGSDDFPSYALGGGGGGGGSSLVPAGGTGTTGTWTGNGYVKITPIGGGAPVTITPAAPAICNGGSVTLTASGGTGTGWSWTPAPGLAGAPTTASVTVNPTSTQVYTVTETGTACPSSASVTVTVNPLPVATATPATSTICTGATSAVTLTADIPGSTFAWTVSQSNVTGGSASSGALISQTLTAVSAPGGSATYTITPTDPATGCVGAPITATVNVEMPVITSVPTTAALCNGSADGTITINAVGVTDYSINGGASYVPSNVFTGLTAGTYNISVMSANGCVNTTTATITQPTPLTVPMSFTDETCAGACDGIAGCAPSGGTAPYSYVWSTGATGSPFIGALCSGSYTVNVTDFNGCTASGLTTVSGPVVVAITSVIPTATQCNGGSDGQIVINASGGATLFSIDGGSTFQASNTFTGLPAGTYTCVAADASGCAATMMTTVNQPSLLTVTPSSPVTICQSQSTNIFATIGGATPPYNITWTDASAAVVGTTASITVSPTTTGSNVYTVTVTDNNGCGPMTASVNVTLRPPLAITAFNDVSICPGFSTSLGVLSATGGDGTYTYTWTNSVNATTLFGADQVVTPTASSTTYTVTLTDGCGSPSASDQMVVTWYVLPPVTYSIDTANGCTPVVVNFTNTTNAGATATYAWNFGDGGTSTAQNPTHTFSGGGSYTVAVNIITSDGCMVDTTITNQITVYDYPQPAFIHNPNPTDVFNTEVTFTNMTIGGFTFTWDFGGLGTSTVMNPQFTFPQDSGGVYNVCMNTVSADGCAASICHEVIVNEVLLVYLPNTFTPDGDNLNEIFQPIMQGYKPETFEFYIFNRWGEVVYKSTDATQGWDGTHNGVKAKEDTYVWKIRVKQKANQEKKEFRGHVNLLR